MLTEFARFILLDFSFIGIVKFKYFSLISSGRPTDSGPKSKKSKLFNSSFQYSLYPLELRHAIDLFLFSKKNKIYNCIN